MLLVLNPYCEDLQLNVRLSSVLDSNSICSLRQQNAESKDPYFILCLCVRNGFVHAFLSYIVVLMSPSALQGYSELCFYFSYTVRAMFLCVCVCVLIVQGQMVSINIHARIQVLLIWNLNFEDLLANVRLNLWFFFLNSNYMCNLNLQNAQCKDLFFTLLVSGKSLFMFLELHSCSDESNCIVGIQ